MRSRKINFKLTEKLNKISLYKIFSIAQIFVENNVAINTKSKKSK